jgi:GMP synthase (glutamine-hydrolysing)
MKRAVVLTHEDFEGPARIAELLAGEGCALDIRKLHRDQEVPATLRRDVVLVVMGGPMGVGDIGDARYPYLAAEVALLRERVADDAPVLGICLGAQLLAHAAGARVAPMTKANGERAYEVGWGPIRFHKGEGHADVDRVLEGLPEETITLHWHGDAFELPSGAHRLASTAACATQGFVLGRRLFGLQFHCETSAEDVEAFAREDAAFVVKANGEGGVERIHAETRRHLAKFRDEGDRLLRNIIRAMVQPS